MVHFSRLCCLKMSHVFNIILCGTVIFLLSSVICACACVCMSCVFFNSVFLPNHSMLGSHLKHFLIATLNSQSKESKLSSTNSNSVFIDYSTLLATSMISFGRHIYEHFSKLFNNTQNVQFYKTVGMRSLGMAGRSSFLKSS